MAFYIIIGIIIIMKLMFVYDLYNHIAHILITLYINSPDGDT